MSMNKFDIDRILEMLKLFNERCIILLERGLVVRILKLTGPKLHPLVLEMVSQDSLEVETCARITEEILQQHRGGHFVNHRQTMSRKSNLFIKRILKINLGTERESNRLSVRQKHKYTPQCLENKTPSSRLNLPQDLRDFTGSKEHCLRAFRNLSMKMIGGVLTKTETLCLANKEKVNLQKFNKNNQSYFINRPAGTGC